MAYGKMALSFLLRYAGGLRLAARSKESACALTLEVPVWEKKASAYANKVFIHIVASCGYRSSMADYEAEEFFFKPNASNEAIGAAVAESLSQSRQLSIVEARERQGSATELYDEWVKRTMERFSYQSKRAMFKGMKRCGIDQLQDHIKFSPTRHDTRGGWEHLGKSKDVLVPLNATPAELGAALRLAFSRCI